MRIASDGLRDNFAAYPAGKFSITCSVLGFSRDAPFTSRALTAKPSIAVLSKGGMFSFDLIFSAETLFKQKLILQASVSFKGNVLSKIILRASPTLIIVSYTFPYCEIFHNFQLIKIAFLYLRYSYAICVYYSIILNPRLVSRGILEIAEKPFLHEFTRIASVNDS